MCNHSSIRRQSCSSRSKFLWRRRFCHCPVRSESHTWPLQWSGMVVKHVKQLNKYLQRTCNYSTCDCHLLWNYHAEQAKCLISCSRKSRWKRWKQDRQRIRTARADTCVQKWDLTCANVSHRSISDVAEAAVASDRVKASRIVAAPLGGIGTFVDVCVKVMFQWLLRISDFQQWYT